MSSTSTGRQAESAAADRLRGQGYEIVAQNWRTRVCEIDLVAKKDSLVYFFEVKFRASSSQGTGLECITATKLKQLRFAAEVWCNEHNWDGDARLSAIEVTADRNNLVVSEPVELD